MVQYVPQTKIAPNLFFSQYHPKLDTMGQHESIWDNTRFNSVWIDTGQFKTCINPNGVFAPVPTPQIEQFGAVQQILTSTVRIQT